MQKIINGKIYDTDTATKMADISGPGGHKSSRDFDYEDTWLYCSLNSTYFIAGEGGGRSRWAEPTGSGMGFGRGLTLVDELEARKLYEQFGDADNYAKFFGEPEIG